MSRLTVRTERRSQSTESQKAHPPHRAKKGQERNESHPQPQTVWQNTQKRNYYLQLLRLRRRFPQYDQSRMELGQLDLL